MEISSKIMFKNLRSHIADAIKESCYTTDVRVYNIANDVHQIMTYGRDFGTETAQDLSKIMDKTIKESVSLGCDQSVIVKGLLLGSFRAWPFNRGEANNTNQVLMNEALKYTFKYNGVVKEAMDGVLASVVIIANEYKLDMHETLSLAKENIQLSANAIDPKFAEGIKVILSNSNDPL